MRRDGARLTQFSQPPAAQTLGLTEAVAEKISQLPNLAGNFLKRALSRAHQATRAAQSSVRCGKSGFRQAPKCCFASHRAFEDFAGDLPTNVMLLGPGQEDFTGSFEGDFHIG